MSYLRHIVSQISIILATLMLTINVAVVMYGVVTRYVLGGAPIWTDELARYAMIGTAFLAAGNVWLRGEHMRVSLAERFLPKKMVTWVLWYQWLITLVIAGTCVWLTARYALSVSMFHSPSLGISRTLPVMCLPVGFALLTMLILLRGVPRLKEQ